MRKLIFTINVSLAGVADHTVAIADDELPQFSTNLLDTVDLLLFGRVRHQLFESYWPFAHEHPHASKSMFAFADQINAMPKILFSNQA